MDRVGSPSPLLTADSRGPVIETKPTTEADGTSQAKHGRSGPVIETKPTTEADRTSQAKHGRSDPVIETKPTTEADRTSQAKHGRLGPVIETKPTNEADRTSQAKHGRSGPVIEKKPTTEADRTSKAKHRRSKHIYYAILGFGLLIIAVAVSGVVYNKQNVEKQSKENAGVTFLTQTANDNDNSTVNPPVNIILELRKFDIVDGLSYFAIITANASGSEAPLNGSEAPLACASIWGAGVILPDILTLNSPGPLYINTTGDVTILSSGYSSRYPFDEYVITLTMYATIGEGSACNSPTAETTATPFSLGISGQALDLAGFSTTFSFAPNPTDGLIFYTLTVLIKRDGTIKLFVVIFYLVTWLLTLATVIATIQAIAYHSEPRFELVGASIALLFALPVIRASMPGIPTTATVADSVGYYWHIALLGFSTSALIIHSVWQLWVKRYKPDRAQQTIGGQISQPPSNDGSHQTNPGEEVLMKKV